MNQLLNQNQNQVTEASDGTGDSVDAPRWNVPSSTKHRRLDPAKIKQGLVTLCTQSEQLDGTPDQVCIRQKLHSGPERVALPQLEVVFTEAE